MEQSLESQIAMINQRLANIEASIEILIKNTKSAQLLSSVVHVKGNSSSLGSIAPQIKDLTQR